MIRLRFDLPSSLPLAALALWVLTLRATSEPLAQPDAIPGAWRLQDDPLPPVEAIAARDPGPVPVYGLYTWANEYKAHRESIRKVGWRSIRMSGPFDDAIMRMLVEDGVEVLRTVQSARPRAFDSEEAFLAAYRDELTRFLERYGPGGSFFSDHPDLPVRPVRVINIWNEPNFQYMIADDPNRPRREVEQEREALYAKLLPAAYAHVKARWPNVRVIGFSAGGASSGEVRWFQNVHALSPAVAKAYDLVSWQPYVDPAPPEAHSIRPWGSYSIAGNVAKNRATLAQYGRADAPVWFTEVGWPISKADGGFFDTPADRAFVTPLLQAAYVVRTYALAMRLGVERVFIMFATDSDRFNGGFFLRDGSWRPSAHAVREMIQRLPNPRLRAALLDGADGTYAWRFAPDRDRPEAPAVVMAWRVAGPKTVELTTNAARVDGFGMLGAPFEVVPENGRYTVEVGPYPIYLVERP